MKLNTLTLKVITRIFGGIGNQLFTYAAARRLALTNNAEHVIDHISGFAYDTQYNRHYQLDHFSIPCRKATPAERLEPFSRARRYLKRRWNKLRPFEQRRYLVQEGIDFDPRLLNLKLNGALYLEGYWQSEGYFKDIEPIIRQDLQIKPPKDAANLKMADQINNSNAVAVHVRFFDHPDLKKKINNAPDDYYQKAVMAMEERVADAHYFLFSDKPDAARLRIPLPDGRMTPVCHNQGDEFAYADLWLMNQCQHFIIANSSFSWWGAWLAENPEKIVIAPGFKKLEGVSSWGFDGLLPGKWVTL